VRTLLITVGLALLPLMPAAAQSKGAMPRTKDGKPDLNGIWVPDGKFTGDITKALKPGESVRMLPAAEKILKTHNAKDDPSSKCLPNGVPRLDKYPEKIVQNPGLILILFEGDIHSYRQIFMDGRTHPKADDLDHDWYGNSIGRWDGDTLVVDTIGFNDRTWLDSVGHPHTEDLHVVERYRRSNTGTLELEVTMEDPGSYGKAFTAAGSFRLQTAGEIRERNCHPSPFGEKAEDYQKKAAAR
jgi:hypothetical protein